MATKLNPDAIQDRSIASIKLQDGVIPSESTVSGWGFTKNAGTITGITMNGASKGTSGVVNLGTVITDVSGKADSSAAIGTLSLSINSSNYQITLSGTKVDGTTFTVSDVIDLPLESVVVNGSYDDTTKKVILTLKNGTTIDFSIADLIDGLQSEITSTNKLSADLIEDGTTNKTVTATEKQTWNSYANVQADWNETTTTEDDYILNKPSIKAGTGTNSIISGDLTNNIASGQNSISIGTLSSATGQNSYSEGFLTFSTGATSHAEGTNTFAISQAGHSEGIKTTAGLYSHAEGEGKIDNSTFTVSGAANATTYTTNVAHNLKVGDVVSYGSGGITNIKITNITSVSELSFTVRNTLSTTALNNVNISIHCGLASGEHSHSEGYCSNAYGNGSHAEGYSTTATGSNSHAEGSNTTANGNSSHTEGNSTIANGSYSHAEGSSTTTENQYEHAQGRYNKSNKENINFSYPGNTIHSIGIGTSESTRKNAFEVMQNGDVYIYGVGDYDGTNPTTADTLQEVISNSSADLATPITYSELVTLKTGGNLVPGAWYRITNYHTTVSPDIDYARSADHQFDVIVHADDESQLNENGYAAHHTGDTYFANENLGAWRIKYSIDNIGWSSHLSVSDANSNNFNKIGTVKINGDTYILLDGGIMAIFMIGCRYVVSEDCEIGTELNSYDNDTSEITSAYNSTISSITGSEGQGTIFMLIDEYNNQLPYDFKNIQFKRWKVTDNHQNRLGFNNRYFGILNSNTPANITIPNENDFIWVYTFTESPDTTSQQPDLSVNQNTANVHDNVIGVYKLSGTNNLGLNDIVFYGFCDCNVFGNNCHSSTLNICSHNTFGEQFNSNFIGEGSLYNSIGHRCSQNTLGGNYDEDQCVYVSFRYNKIGHDFQRNSIDVSFEHNSVGDYYQANIVGKNCSSNSFGDYCSGNSFGDCFSSNTLGDYCQNNSFGGYFLMSEISGNMQYCIVTGGSQNSQIKNTNIISGFAGEDGDEITITFESGKEYRQIAGLVNGTDLRIWIAEDTVTGPSTSTGNNLAAFDGTTGKIIKDSGIALSSLSNLVHTTGTETITGGKTFTSNTTFKSGISILNSAGTVGVFVKSNNSNDGQLEFYAGQDDSAVQLQNIATPTNNSDAANKSYVDGQVAIKYTKPSGGIPSTDLASAVQTSLGKADTALQSYTETDPIFTASAAHGITSNDITNWNSKTSNVGTITGITMNGTSKGTSGVVNLGTVITSETALSKGTTTGNGNAVTDISVNGHEITLTKGATFLTEELEPDFNNSPAKEITDSQINQWDAKVSANNGMLTIQKNGTQVATFSANQATNQTANIQVNELPSVSASDNGKILMVVNGAWSLVTPVSIYNGTSTPDSSLGENGDIYIQTNS